MKRLFYSVITILSLSSAAYGQYSLGIAASNWSGIYGLYMNPANIADSRARFSIDIASLNGGLDNNLGYINTQGGLIGTINKGNTDNIFTYNNNSKFSLLAPYAQVHLPSLMVSINHIHSVALTLGIRGMNQFNNFDQSLYRTITDPKYAPNSNIDLTSNRFNYTAHVWSEIGASYAAVILDQEEHELRAGVTLRYLGGIGYLGLKGHNLDAHYKSGGNDSLFVTNSDIEFASNILSTRDAILNGVSNHSILSEFFGAKDGSGFGADIGLVYDYMPNYERDKYESRNGRVVTTDYSKNRYKLRISASIMDIGAITYKAANNSNANVTGNGVIAGKDFSDNVKNFDDFRHYAVSHGFTADTGHRDTKVYMPTTLRLGADYKIYRRFYVNATFIGNLANRENFGTSYYSQITVTPRYDRKMLSVGLPITYGFLSQAMKVGIGVRLGGFFVGSDDMLALIASHQSGVNFYIGGMVSVNKRTPGGYLRRDEQPEPDMDHGGSSDTLDGREGFNYQRHMNSMEPQTAFSSSVREQQTLNADGQPAGELRKTYAKKERD